MILTFIFLNLVILFSSYLVTYRFCRDCFFSTQILAAFLFYTFQITASILFLGVVVKDLGPFNLILLNLAVSITVVFFLRKEILAAFTSLGKEIREFFKGVISTKDYFLYLFLFLFIFQIAAILVKVYFLPPFVGDVFSYHLHPVIDWFQQGQILSYTDTPVWRANENPLGTKPLHFWWLIFLGNFTWIEMPQFIFGVILSISAYNLMVQGEISKNSALRYGILIYFIPAVLLQSRTNQDHLIFAACALLTLSFAVAVFYRGQYRQVLPLFVAMGFLFGIKKHSLLVIAVLFVTLIVSRGFSFRKILEFSRRHKDYLAAGVTFFILYSSYFFIFKTQLYRQLYHRFSKKFFPYIFIAMLLLVSLFLLVKWLAKKISFSILLKRYSWTIIVVLGLILISFAGLLIKNRHLLKPFFLGYPSPIISANRNFAKEYPRFDNTLMKNLLAFPFRIKDIGQYTSYTPDFLDKSGFGIQFFALGLVAFMMSTIWWLFKQGFRNSIMGFLLIFALLLLAVYFSIYFSWANYRSFIFFPVLGIILWSYVAKKIFGKKYYQFLLDLFLIIMILFNGAVCFFEGNMSGKRWKTLFTLERSQERTSVKYAPLIWTSKDKETWDYIDCYIKADQPVGYLAGGAAWIFPYFDNRGKRRIYYLKSLPGFKLIPVEKGDSKYKLLNFSPNFKASLILRGIHFFHINNHGISRYNKVVIREDNKNIIKVTSSLFYFKYKDEVPKEEF